MVSADPKVIWNLRWTFLTGTKTIVPLGDVAQGYVGNVLALMSALALKFNIWKVASAMRSDNETLPSVSRPPVAPAAPVLVQY